MMHILSEGDTEISLKPKCRLARHVTSRNDSTRWTPRVVSRRDVTSQVIWDTAEARGIDTSDAALTLSTDCYNRLELLQLFR